MKIVSTTALLLAAALGAACTTATGDPAEGATQHSVSALGGGTLAIEGITIADSTATVASVSARIDGKDARLELDAAAHRITLRMDQRVLELREDGALVTQKASDERQGESIETTLRPGHATTMEALRIRVREGHVAPAAVRRYGATLPVADALARELPEQAWAADLIARFADEALSPVEVGGTVTPRRLPSPGDCVSSCSVNCGGGAYASASCTQGWFTCNTATCSCGSSGGASASCDW